jgi:hypothetical protein
MKLVEDTYFKHPGNFISGCALPLNDNGIVENVCFLHCTFHPACSEICFVNCVFISCQGEDYIYNTSSQCITIDAKISFEVKK